MDNRLKRIWQDGETAYGGWLSLYDDYAASMMGDVGFDYLVVDMQHGLADYTQASRLLQSVAISDSVPMARVPWNDPSIIGRVLDAGALGIVVPMVNSAEEAAAAAEACRYAPDGARSWGPTRAARLHGDYQTAAANDTVLCIPMIETAQAVAAIDDILAVPGIDAIYVGPADLSLTYGLPPAGDNEGPFVIALEKILDACTRHGVVPGIHANAALAPKRRSQGFRMITVGSDAQALAQGAAAMFSDGTAGSR
jgi:4-hydroxy-2-oxoheptanedioate aldolase